MNIQEIKNVIEEGKVKNRKFYGYYTNKKIIIVEATEVEEVLKELIVKIKDKEKPIIVEKFFYFDYIEFTGLGGAIIE